MPAPDADNVVVAGTGGIYTAPVATVLPVDIDTALPAAFNEVGFTTEDGVTRTDGKSVEGVPAWQSFYDIRKFVSGKSMTIGFTLREYNPDTVTLAFGGGAVAVVAGPPAHSIYTPPPPEEIDYRALIVEYHDGADDFRFVVPRGMVTGDVESNLTRTGPLDLPIGFDISPEGRPTAGVTEAALRTQPWYEISNKGVFVAP